MVATNPYFHFGCQSSSEQHPFPHTVVIHPSHCSCPRLCTFPARVLILVCLKALLSTVDIVGVAVEGYVAREENGVAMRAWKAIFVAVDHYNVFNKFRFFVLSSEANILGLGFSGPGGNGKKHNIRFSSRPTPTPTAPLFLS